VNTADTLLHYRQPASRFEEALPIGNGRLGAMIHGRPWHREDYFSERIPLNEETIWYGGPTQRENPDALKTLPEVRRLLLNGEVTRAEDLADTGLTATPRNGSPYQSLGELVITSPASHGAIAGYRRSLDIERAVAAVAYSVGKQEFQMEAWASAPDEVLVFDVKCRHLPFHFYLRRRPFDGVAFRTKNGIVGIEGQAGPEGVRFCVTACVLTSGGASCVEGQSIRVSGAARAMILVAAWSSFRKSQPRSACMETLRRAAARGRASLRKRHIAHHINLFRRVSLNLGPVEKIPTDRRLERVRGGHSDPSLAALLYQYGRYLLISTSRPDTLPMTLQGIWCDSMTPIWNCNYTLNVNLQMSYWPAESGALPECHSALMAFLPRLVECGKVTARRMYGCRGFVAHHTTDLWADAAPTGGVYASSLWPFGGAWLALHAWEHFLFGQDVPFLRGTGYGILREAAVFFSDYLTKNRRGESVAVPSVSPENFFVLPGGSKGKACAGAAMDSQILRELLSAVIEASELLGVDAVYRRRWREILATLPALKVRQDGTIQEWEDFSEDCDPGHRHLSHLFGLFPGSTITPESASSALAARKTLDLKLSHPTNCTGWSQAWMVNLFARLGRGDDAGKCLERIICQFTNPSLLGDCPPLNLDSNFGLCSGIAEMLLQSHGGIIRLLPALPSGWKSGEVHGLRARGGLKVSMRWSGGQLISASLLSRTNTEVRILSPAPLMQKTSLVREVFGQACHYRASLKGGRKFTLQADRPRP